MMTFLRRIKWDLLSAALLIAAITVMEVLTASCMITSDPSGYLCYGKQLAQGHLFYPLPPADIVLAQGGKFEASVFHGYLFANSDGKIYPFFSIGFPLIIAGAIRLLGLAWGPMVNVFILPLFLVVLYAFMRMAVAGQGATTRRWAPLLSLALASIIFREHIHVWSMAYRELPATLLALTAVLIVGWTQRSRAARLTGSIAAALLIGLSAIVRETTVLMAPACVLLRTLEPLPSFQFGRFFRRSVIYGLLTLAVMAAAYSPQFVVNRIMRGHEVTNKQMEYATQRISNTEFADDEDSTEGFSIRNFQTHFPRHLKCLWMRFNVSAWFLPLGLLAIALRRDLRALVLLLIPGLFFLLVQAAWSISPPVSRYDFAIYLLLLPLPAIGLCALTEWMATQVAAGHPRVSRTVIALPALTLLALAALVAWNTIRVDRQVGQARQLERFRADLAALVPTNSIILAEIPSRDYLEYLSAGHAVSLHNILQQDISVKGFTASCRERNLRLFLFTGANRDLNSTPFTSRELEGMVRQEASLRAVTNFVFADYGLREAFACRKAELYELGPLVNRRFEDGIPNFSTGPGRLEFHAGSWRDPTPPVATLDGAPLPGIVVGSNLFVAATPPSGESVRQLKVEAGRPLPDDPQAIILPVSCAFTIRLGQDASDHPWLGHEWFSDDRPSVGDGYRFLRSNHSFRFAGLIPALGPHADLFIQTTPFASTSQGVRWSQAPATNIWHEAIPCLDANRFGLGFVCTNIDLAIPVLIKSDMKPAPRAHVLSLGHFAPDTATPVTPDAHRSRLWPVVAINTQSPGMNGRCFVARSLPSSQDNAKALTLQPPRRKNDPDGLWQCLLLPPLGEKTELTFAKYTTDAASFPLLNDGFQTCEPRGIWTRSEFSLLSPPWPTRSRLRMTFEDHRATNSPPLRLSSSVGKAGLFDQIWPAGSGSRTIEFDIPYVTPTSSSAEPETIQFHATPWTPAKDLPKNTDKRSLGIFFTSVDIRPSGKTLQGEDRLSDDDVVAPQARPRPTN